MTQRQVKKGSRGRIWLTGRFGGGKVRSPGGPSKVRRSSLADFMWKQAGEIFSVVAKEAGEQEVSRSM